MIYVWHHAVTLVGSIVLGAALSRRRWTRVHPRLAVTLWHLLAFTTVVSLFALLLSLGFQAMGLGVGPAIGTLADGHAVAELGVVELTALLAALVVAAGAAGLHVTSTLHRARARSRHRALLSVVGDDGHRGLTVVDHSAVVVYALPGRRPRIIATSGALDQLDDDEQQAVIAHERGHLAGRHGLALLPFFILRRAFPRWRIAAAVEAEVELLLEMCADNYAVRRGHRAALVRAIGVFTAHGHSGGPATTLDCAQADALRARRDRLTVSAGHRRFLTVTGLYATALTLAATTLSLYVLPA